MDYKLGETKVYYLEGLRGIAAFIVVIYHFLSAFTPGLYVKTAHSIINILFNGHFAVCIFFVLSAYVLSFKFFQTGDKKIIISGALRRYIRLEIPVLVSIVLVYLLMNFKLLANIEAGIKAHSEWLSSFWLFQSDFFKMLQEATWGVFIGNKATYNSVLWTMYYEFFGSFLVFGFCAVFGKSNFRYGIYPILIFMFYKTFYLAFVLGLILSDFYNSGRTIQIQSLLKWGLLLIGLILGSYRPGNANFEFLNFNLFAGIDLEIFYQVIGSFLILWFILESKTAQGLLSNPMFRYLGRVSFPMYLIHWPILGSFSSYLYLVFSSMGIGFNYCAIFVFLISLPLIFLASDLFSKIIDIPSVAAARRISSIFLSRNQNTSTSLGATTTMESKCFSRQGN